jgi:hypothetical protein
MRIPNHIGTVSDKKLELPEDAVTQGFGIIGKRGKGKSNILASILEIIARRGQSFVVLDPPDAHWGIRFAAGKDGLPVGPSGFDVLLVGGEHGDVPLDPNGGVELAQVIVAGDISCVISLRGMTYTAQQRFAADFGEEIFRINRTPRFIAFEEAHNFLPQQLRFDEQKRVLHAMDRIITEGRSSGLGYAVASQRPARINKDALEEVDNLFALGMPGPNDLDQVENWFKRHVRGDKAKLHSILDEIASLPPGECWLLSPDWLGDLVKMRARLRVTYHAGRTPKPGERKVSLAKFSVTEAVKQLKEKFAAKQQQRSQEVADLKEAKTKIRNLENELRKVKSGLSKAPVASAPVVDKKAVQRAVAAVEGQFKAQVAMYRTYVQKLNLAVQRILQAAGEVSKIQSPKDVPIKLPKLEEKFHPMLGVAPPGHKFTHVAGTMVSSPARFKRAQAADVADTGNGQVKLTGGAVRMLSALVQWHPRGMSEGHLRSNAGLSRGGTFDTYKSYLRSAGLIDKGSDGLLHATEAGIDYFSGDVPTAPQSTEEVVAVWKQKLSGGACRMLDVIVQQGGEPISKEELMVAANLSKGGTFDTYLSYLRTAHLIKVERGMVMGDKETLFL